MLAPAHEGTALLIDDDVELCGMLKDYLARHGWVVTAHHRGDTGLQAALEHQHRVILLDVMLPDLDGFEVLRRLRRQSSVNVLLLTARGEDVDRIVGLELGADDYLPKPFNPRELVARMRAIVRRGTPVESVAGRRTAVGRFVVDHGLRSVSFDGSPLDLTGLEFLLLSEFLSRQFEVIPREELVAKILERPFRPLDRSIDMHVSRLRKKLEMLPGFGGEIRAIRNAGYLFSPAGRAED